MTERTLVVGWAAENQRMPPGDTFFCGSHQNWQAACTLSHLPLERFHRLRR
jgi:hypothetical protein